MSDPKDVERALRDALGRLFDAVEDAFGAAGPKRRAGFGYMSAEP